MAAVMSLQRHASDDRADPENRLSAASKVPEFTAKERDAVEVQSRPSAVLIHETIRAEGQSELERTVAALLLSGLAAGLSMGFSLITEGLLHARLPSAPWQELVSKFGYTVGFLIVVLGRQQLFTENTLTPILPLLHHRNLSTFTRVLRLWAIVLGANVAATWLVAAVLAHTDVFDSATKAAFTEISRHSVSMPFWDTVLKAIFAGWLIALMVWLLPAAETARPFIIIIVTYVVGLGGFTHVIAGSVDVLYLVESGAASWTDFLARFFAPTLLGNVVGGVTLVAVLNYGQVAPEIE
jgi:formate/nitrite transporter FocA (FNT family)